MPSLAPRLLEQERRDVPAGNVTATLVGYHLRIDGDAAANHVILRGHGAGVVEVQGVDTTLNGANGKLTFTGVGLLEVNVADGNDAVQTHDLTVGNILVFGGSGDDRVHLNRTTDRPSIQIWGDNSPYAPDGTNGEDTIRVTNTTASGDLSLTIVGDTNGDAKHDTISLENTTLTAGEFDYVWFDLGIYAGFEPGAGDDITIDDFDVTADVVGAGWSAGVLGSPGDDHIRIRNCDIDVQTEQYAFGDFYVDGDAGFDTVEVENVNHSVTTTRTVGSWLELANQVYMSVVADTVRVNNLDFVGGGLFFDPDEGFYYVTNGSVGILGSEVDLRNTSVHTNGFGGLYVSTTEWYDGIEREDSWSFANVRVTSAHGQLGDLFLDTGSGNDGIAMTNTSCETFFAYLGEGDDTLQMTNVSGNVYLEFNYGGIYGGGGNDTVGMTNCTFQEQLIDLGEGDDELTLFNNSFGELVADLGDGDDTATVTNNTATTSIAIDGGGGDDTLIAWLNLAPFVDFDNFEL